ncbi:MAG: hypothetical protein QF570_21020 [Myxococcota bacterium]|nr:hypothetical protein [Myxococcota bacterium]
MSERLEGIGAGLREREEAEREKLEYAWKRAGEIHGRVEAGLAGFARGAGGVEHLAVELSAPRRDDKHFHAVQFDVSRGRHRVIATVKTKGVVTLVGPFKDGDTEGPCKRIDLDDDAAIDAGLEAVLADFLDTAFAS